MQPLKGALPVSYIIRRRRRRRHRPILSAQKLDPQRTKMAAVYDNDWKVKVNRCACQRFLENVSPWMKRQVSHPKRTTKWMEESLFF